MGICYPVAWQDWVELIIIYFSIYTIQRWLSTDTRIPLLIYAYGYISLVISIYYAELTTLIPCIPIITFSLLIFTFIVHKKNLQKDIIPYTRTLHNTYDPLWLEVVLRSSASILNPSRDIIVLFEHTDELTPFLVTPYRLESDVQPELLKILLNPNVYTSDTMLWINSSGIIISNKAQWHIPSDHTIESDVGPLLIKNLSFLYTFKTNALVCLIDQNNRTACIIVHGTQLKAVPLYQAYDIIAKHLHIKIDSILTSKALYETSSTTKQHTT